MEISAFSGTFQIFSAAAMNRMEIEKGNKSIYELMISNIASIISSKISSYENSISNVFPYFSS